MKPFTSPQEREVLREAKKVRAGINKCIRDARPKHQPAAPSQRQPRERDNEHLKRIRRLPCLATLIREGREAYGVDAAHVRANYPGREWGGNPGMARKPHDWRTLPLRHEIHMEQHGQNEVEFWDRLHVYPPDICGALRGAADFEAMLQIVRAAARRSRKL